MEVKLLKSLDEKQRYQFRFPKSKKKRVRKKWSRRESNFRIKEVPKGVQLGNILYVNQIMYNKLKSIKSI